MKLSQASTAFWCCCLLSSSAQRGAFYVSADINVTKSIELIDGDVYDVPALDSVQDVADTIGLSVREVAQGFQPDSHLVASNLPNARQKKIWDLVGRFDEDYRTSALWEK